MAMTSCELPSLVLPNPISSANFINSDILKIDIEGSEFDALRSLKAKMDHQNEAFFPIGQMLIEIHFYGKTLDLPGFLAWWQMLEKGGFRPTWTEPNLLAVTMRNDDGMPRLSEVRVYRRYLWCFMLTSLISTL